MHVLAPWWGVVLAPLAAGIILLYLLKLRRRDFRVSSVFLWEQALQDLQANAPFQKLRKNLLLIIQLLIAFLLVLALMRPAMQWFRPGGQRVLLILDASASMQSTDVSPSRFVAAVTEAHRAIAALGPRDQMMIIIAGCTTHAITPFTGDKRTLHTALSRQGVTDGPADMRGALELVAGLLHGEKGGNSRQLLIISDGALPILHIPAGLASLPIHYVKIGMRCDNVGIIVMSLRRRVSRAGGYEGLIGVKNFSVRAKTFTLELTVNGRLRDAREITLPAGGQRTDILNALPTEGGILEAHLDIHDDLTVDNTAWLVVPKVESIPVVLATTGNLFLETVLGLDPTLSVSTRESVPSVLATGTVLIVDNIPASKLPPGVSALLIGAVGACAPGSVRRTVELPTIVDWNHRHPVLANVSLRDVAISSAQVLAPTPTSSSLIETNDGPIALVSEAQGRRLVYLGWDLRRSDFPLRIGFPIFIGNCLDWLSGQRQRAQLTNVHTGQPLLLAVPADVTAITLETPQHTRELIGVSGMTVTLEQMIKTGIYHVTATGMQETIAANLLDTRESNILPNGQLELEGARGRVGVAPGRIHTEQELWRLLLLLALLLLCLEWWIFHRRIG